MAEGVPDQTAGVFNLGAQRHPSGDRVVECGQCRRDFGLAEFDFLFRTQVVGYVEATNRRTIERPGVALLLARLPISVCDRALIGMLGLGSLPPQEKC